MSWFTKFVEHPALNALHSLSNHPAIKDNPGAVAAVEDAQKTATSVAGVVTAAAHQVEAAAVAAADPLLADLGAGLQAAVDGFLMTLGPVGAIGVQPANALIAMGEQWAHNHLAALFGHAKKANADAQSITSAPPPSATLVPQWPIAPSKPVV